MCKRQYLLPIIAAGMTAFVLLLFLVATRANAQGGQPELPAAKQTVVAGEATRQAEADQRSRAPKEGTPPPNSCPRNINELKSEAGIRSHSEGKMGPKGMTPINSANVMSRNGVPYVIQAGSKSDEPQQGMLVVTRVSLDPCADIASGQVAQPQYFASPFKEGAVRITEIDGDDVILTTSSGRTVRFGYVVGQFR